MFEAGSLLTSADTNTRSPHTTGLETATPSTGVFHRMFSLVATFQVTAVGVPSATPEAFGPRNMGQFCAETPADPIRQIATKTRTHEKPQRRFIASVPFQSAPRHR